MKINNGNIITIENNKEYICFSTIEDNSQKYIYLMSNFTPLEIRFAKLISDEEIEIIYDQEEKKKIFELFKLYNIGI